MRARSALLAQLAQRAREEGHCTLRASVLATNRRSITMLLRAGFAPIKSEGTIREYQRLLTSADAGEPRACGRS